MEKPKRSRNPSLREDGNANTQRHQSLTRYLRLCVGVTATQSLARLHAQHRLTLPTATHLTLETTPTFCNTDIPTTIPLSLS